MFSETRRSLSLVLLSCLVVQLIVYSAAQRASSTSEGQATAITTDGGNITSEASAEGTGSASASASASSTGNGTSGRASATSDGETTGVTQETSTETTNTESGDSTSTETTNTESGESTSTEEISTEVEESTSTEDGNELDSTDNSDIDAGANVATSKTLLVTTIGASALLLTAVL